MTSRGAEPAGTTAEALEGVRAQLEAGLWGKGIAGATTRENLPALVPSSCGMIPPSSAGETESRRGVRGEGAKGFIPESNPHPPAAVSQRPAAPPRPISSSPSRAGRGAVKGVGPCLPIPLLWRGRQFVLSNLL